MKDREKSSVIPIRQIQFVDRNITKKDFEDFGDHLLISSMFYTLQGEGPFAGYPAVFIRFAGCNRGNKIDCPWCDTNFLFDKGRRMLVSNIVARVCDYRNEHSKDNPIVVITGGEPLLQSKGLEKLVAQLVEENFQVQIETNGDLLRLESVPRATVVCSPKVSMRTKKYKQLPVGALARADYLKFLVEDVPGSPYSDVPEYASQFADVKGSYHVLISPISEYQRDIGPKEVASAWTDLFNKKIMERNHKYAAKLVMEKGFRGSMQTHLFWSLE